MSNEAITWAYSLDGLKSGAKFVLVTLANYADSEGSCFPGIGKIARQVSAGESTVRANLEVLKKAKLITEERRHRKDGSRSSNRYWLAVGGVIDLTPESSASEIEGLALESGEPSAGIEQSLAPESGGAIETSGFNTPEEPTVLMPTASFEDFWNVWPRKDAKADARRAWNRAVKRADADMILRAATVYAESPYRPEKQFVPYGASWLNKDRWDDPAPEAPESPRTGPSGPNRPLTNTEAAFQLAAQMRAERQAREAADRKELE